MYMQRHPAPQGIWPLPSNPVVAPGAQPHVEVEDDARKNETHLGECKTIVV